MVTKYQKCISGPMLDRIDIHVEVPRVDYENLSGDRVGESGEAIRARVQTARDKQQARFSKLDSKYPTSHPEISAHDCRLGREQRHTICALISGESFLLFDIVHSVFAHQVQGKRRLVLFRHP